MSASCSATVRAASHSARGATDDDGLPALVQCPGSFATATCQACGLTFRAADIADAIVAGRVPTCTARDCDGVVKPDIVFFYEGLPDIFGEHIRGDCAQADLFIVVGSSLKVTPVSKARGRVWAGDHVHTHGALLQIVTFLPSHVPAVLINREVVGAPSRFDVELLGNADDIVQVPSMPAVVVSLPNTAPAPHAVSRTTLGLGHPVAAQWHSTPSACT